VLRVLPKGVLQPRASRAPRGSLPRQGVRGLWHGVHRHTLRPEDVLARLQTEGIPPEKQGGELAVGAGQGTHLNRARVTAARLCADLTRVDVMAMMSDFSPNSVEYALSVPNSGASAPSTVIEVSANLADRLAGVLGVPLWWLEEAGPPQLKVGEPSTTRIGAWAFNSKG
jgi:hypothetical protein